MSYALLAALLTTIVVVVFLPGVALIAVPVVLVIAGLAALWLSRRTASSNRALGDFRSQGERAAPEPMSDFTDDDRRTMTGQ